MLPVAGSLQYRARIDFISDIRPPNATGGTKTCLDFLPPIFLLLLPPFLLVTDRYSNRKCGIWPGDVFSLSCLRITHHLPSSRLPPPLTCSPPPSFSLSFDQHALNQRPERALPFGEGAETGDEKRGVRLCTLPRADYV